MLNQCLIHIRHIEAIDRCMVCNIWACIIKTRSRVGGGGGLVALLSLFSFATQLQVFAIW
jgi:hypothetical protein